MVRLSAVRNSLLLTAALVLPAHSAQAELVSTDHVVPNAAIQGDREKIRAFLSRAEAQRGLKALGVDAGSARQRVDALTDSEVVSLAGKIDSLPAGGNLGTSDIIIILLVAILVALIV